MNKQVNWMRLFLCKNTRFSIETMSALLRPPQPPASYGRGRGGRFAPPSVGGRGGPPHNTNAAASGGGRGRGGHGIPNVAGRGRVYPQQHQPVQPRRSGGELINVGVLIRYADMSINQGRYRWPPTITERQALHLVLSSQSDADLGDIIEITFSQTPRVGVARIAWLDTEPQGHYYMNQHIYGEGGLQSQLNAELRDRDLVYEADLGDIQYVGSLDDYHQMHQHQQEQQFDRVGPRSHMQQPTGPMGPMGSAQPLRYDPNVL